MVSQNEVVHAKSWCQLMTPREAPALLQRQVIAPFAHDYRRARLKPALITQTMPDGMRWQFTLDSNGSGFRETVVRYFPATGAVLVAAEQPAGEVLFEWRLLDPKVGNIDHGFTLSDTLLPQRHILAKLGAGKVQQITDFKLPDLRTALKGRLAFGDAELALKGEGQIAGGLVSEFIHGRL